MKELISVRDMTEDFIAKTLYGKLCSDKDLLVARQWKGWTIRGAQERAEKQLFDREFDIAVFKRGPRRSFSPFYEIELTGYEIKGHRKGSPPSFMEGLDQAIMLLEQFADFAYLVYPDLGEEARNRMKRVCDRYAQHVGIMLLRTNGDFWKFREPQKNQSTTLDIKRDLLARFVTSGHASARRVPDWAKKGDYG